ncbi:Lrp/AsnC ligand binding domain-containing protein [Candidatus Bathyarchaeota archaeon]|nr:Lrp/AsnC ligand binding domain-containing protein [Candidatus Bathyarchaeota archaeon]
MLKNIKAIPEVQETHIVYGAYDIIAKLETETMQDLKEIISWKIRGQDKVRLILTMIVI